MKLDTYLFLVVLKDIAKQIKKGNAGFGDLHYHRIGETETWEVSGSWVEKSGPIRIIHAEGEAKG